MAVLLGDVEIRHSTFTGNEALAFGHALTVVSGSEVRLRNTLIAQNPFGVDADPEVYCAGSATLTLDGFNLIDVIHEDYDFLDESPVDLDVTGYIDGGISGYSESPIGHHKLQSDSVAIDHGPTACGPTDQIGNPRSVDRDGIGLGNCDTGAIEFLGN